jgi:hypothetical protein
MVINGSHHCKLGGAMHRSEPLFYRQIMILESDKKNGATSDIAFSHPTASTIFINPLIGILLHLPPHPCYTNEAKTKKQHGGRFGNQICWAGNLCCIYALNHLSIAFGEKSIGEAIWGEDR